MTHDMKGDAFIRYDEIKRLYPDIDYLISDVCDFVHDPGIGPLMAMGYADKWIRRYIAKEHQEPVAKKIAQIINAIS